MCFGGGSSTIHPVINKIPGFQGMNQAQRKQLLQLVTGGLLLACAPLNQLGSQANNNPAIATGAAIVAEGDLSALNAYQNLDKLPGYRLQTEQTMFAGAAVSSTVTTITERDAVGNSHTTAQTDGGPLYEIYTVNRQTYTFNTQYNGWVPGNDAGALLTGPPQWLLQLGVVPTVAGSESIQERNATRYRLQYLLSKLTAAEVGPRLQGAIWVDDQTGALLKADLQLVEDKQPRQKITLEVSQIGAIAAIQPPTPVINPDGVAAATATAQAWATLQIGLSYQGRPIEFELTPVEVRRQKNSSAAAMQLVLRKLPPELLEPSELDRFLTQLGSRLTLSIPQKNLTANSAGFQLKNTSPTSQTVTVNYMFNANLENFSHIELILSNSGSPVVAPVPVAGN